MKRHQPLGAEQAVSAITGSYLMSSEEKIKDHVESTFRCLSLERSLLHSTDLLKGSKNIIRLWQE